MKKGISKTLKIFSVIIVIIYTITYALTMSFFSNHSLLGSLLYSDIFTLIGNTLSIVFIIIGIRSQKGQCHISWRLFLLGLVFTFVGDFIWIYSELVLNQEVALVSISDVFYLLGCLCYLLGLIYYIKKEKSTKFVYIGFDILITMVACGTILVKYVMLPIWTSNDITLLEKYVSILYPLFDLGYIAGLTTLLFISSKKRPRIPTIIIILSFTTYLIADLFYAVAEGNTVVFGNYIDILWPFAALLLSISIFFCTKKSDNSELQSTQNPTTIKYREMFFFLLPYIWTGVAIILVSHKYLLIEPLVTGTILSFTLVIIRQLFYLWEHKKLLLDLQISNEQLLENKRKIDIQAKTDYLTGLYNRRYIYEYIHDYMVKVSEKDERGIAILMIDVDYYKSVNDTWGHAIGDLVLIEIAEIIRKNIGDMGVAARFGGDEFIVFIENSTPEKVQELATTLLKDTNDKSYVEAPDLHTSLSIGCAFWKCNVNTFDFDRLLSESDKVLYEVKSSGRNHLKMIIL